MPTVEDGGDGRTKEKGTETLQASPQSGSTMQAFTVKALVPIVDVATSNLSDPSG